MALAVELQRAIAQRDDRVVVARLVRFGQRRLGGEKAEKDVTVSLARDAREMKQHAIGHFVGKHRIRALGQHDQSSAALVDERCIDIERPLAKCRIELDFLNDVSLHERYRERRAFGMRPFKPRQRTAAGIQHDGDNESRCDSPSAAQRKCVVREREHRSDQRDALRYEKYAADRRVTGERASRKLGIAHRKPGHSGEEPAAHPFA